MNRHFFKKVIQEANKYMKRCSISLVIRKMQIKTTKRYYYWTIRLAKKKKKKSTNLIVPKTDEVVELRKDYQMLLEGMQTSIIDFEKSLARSSNHSTYPIEICICALVFMYKKDHSSTACNSPKLNNFKGFQQQNG